MVLEHAKNSQVTKTFFNSSKKLPYLVTLFQSQLLRNWAEQSKFWWIFFYEKSFYLSNKKRMKCWASILKKLAYCRCFARCTIYSVRFQKKNSEKNFWVFFFKNTIVSEKKSSFWCWSVHIRIWNLELGSWNNLSLPLFCFRL